MMNDDLDCNPFYNVLQECFPEVFDRAQAKCWTICVPQSASLECVNIDRQFIDLHILKPSPFFKGQYLTTGTAADKQVLLEDNTLTTGEGFSGSRAVKIVGEETSYNKDYKPLKIFILERPLIGIVGAAAGNEQNPLAFDAYLSRFSHKDLRQYLNDLPECQGTVAKLQQKLHLFLQSYMMLEGYLSEAAEKLHQLYIECAQMVMGQVSRLLVNNPRVVENVERAVESELLGSCHKTLYPLICGDCESNDQELSQKLEELKDITPEELGLPDQYCCPLLTPVNELKQIGQCQTPLEKLHCLKCTLDSTVETVNLHAVPSTAKEAPCVTSDELIPLLTLVLIQSRDVHTLCSDLYYAENFHWASSNADDLSFSLVTFSATVKYALTLKSQKNNQNSNNKVRNEPFKVDVCIDSKLTKQKMSNTHYVDGSNCITKMLQSSTADFTSPSHKMRSLTLSQRTNMSNVLPTQNQKAPLGDFLSSLQDDGQYSSYGRLT